MNRAPVDRDIAATPSGPDGRGAVGRGNITREGRRFRLAFGLTMVVSALGVAWVGHGAAGGWAVRVGVFVLLWLGALGLLQARAWT